MLCRLTSDLRVSTVHGVVEGGASRAVGHVQTAELRQQHLGAACGFVGSGHMQRRLPQLVPSVHFRPLPQQQPHGPLGNGGGRQTRLIKGSRNRSSFYIVIASGRVRLLDLFLFLMKNCPPKYFYF